MYELCRGRDFQAVSIRTLVKSIACSKNFLGKAALKTDSDILQWLTNLAGELVERIALDRANHNRLPTGLYFYTRVDGTETKSKSLPSSILAAIPKRGQNAVDEEVEAQIAQKIAEIALEAVKSIAGGAPITCLCLSAGKFQPDHVASCGDVKKLLSEQERPAKRESFFRQFIQPQEQPESPPKRSSRGVGEQHRQPSTSKGRDYFQHHEVTAETIMCEECGSRVLVHLMPEHADFHFAKKVQQEWNREVNQTTRSPIMPTSTKPSRGAKRSRGRGKKEVGYVKLDNFLIKKD